MEVSGKNRNGLILGHSAEKIDIDATGSITGLF